MTLSDYYAPILGSSLGGALGYAIRQKPTDLVVGLGAGGVLGWLIKSQMQIGDSPKIADGNPNAPSKLPANIPAPPVGRPEIPQEAELLFAGQSPDPACVGLYRSYYGVHDWNEDPNGVPHPVWDLIGRWHGSFLTSHMIPWMDQFYGQGYDCHYNYGVWAVSPGAAQASACQMGGSFKQVGRSRFDCGMGPVAKG